MKRARWALFASVLVALAATSAIGSAPQGPAAPAGSALSIDHVPIQCAVAEQHPKVAACFVPDTDLGRAQVHFRGSAQDPWFAVAMQPDGPCHSAYLPRPMKGTAGFEYYVHAVDRSFNEATEPAGVPGNAVKVRVIEGGAKCGVGAVAKSAAAGSIAPIILNVFRGAAGAVLTGSAATAAEAAVVMHGFQAAGVLMASTGIAPTASAVSAAAAASGGAGATGAASGAGAGAAGGGAGAGGAAAGGAAAGGAGAGTAAAGAAAGGAAAAGGISTVAVVAVAGAGVAAAGVAVASAGGEDATPASTTPTTVVTTTTTTTTTIGTGSTTTTTTTPGGSSSTTTTTTAPPGQSTTTTTTSTTTTTTLPACQQNAPSVNQPGNGQVVSNQQAISCSISGSNVCARTMDFRVSTGATGEITVGGTSDASGTVDWNTRAFPNGAASIRCVANYSGGGSVSSSPVNVTINNTGFR